MATFAILRTQKLKHLASIRRSLKHSFREQETPNANPYFEEQNIHIGAQNTSEAMAKIEAILPEKRRKDAVLAIEYLITASPEAMQSKTIEQQNAYFSASLEWLQQQHGDNLVYAGVHRDETTPHLYAYVVPLDHDTGRLNAKKWLGGPKALNAMQTEFAKRVGEPHGLARGIEGSKAKHQRVKAFYGALSASEPQIQIDPKELEPKLLEKTFFTKTVESPQMIAQRLSTSLREQVRPLALAASQSAGESRRAQEAVKTAQTLQKQFSAFQGLSERDREGLELAAERLKRQRAEEFKLKREQERAARRAKSSKGRGGRD